jgi:hypothetical protein
MQRWAALTTFFLAGCASAGSPALQAGPDAEVTFDGLTRLDNPRRLDAVWLREDIDLSGYTKILLQGEGIEYRPETAQARANREFPISEASKERLRQILRDAFVDALSASDRFELVTEAGPDVLLVRGAVLDVVSNVPPRRTDGTSDVFISSLGEATLVIELRDSQSDAILARAADRDAAQDMSGRMIRANAATSWSEVSQLAQRWARALRDGLEELAEAGLPPTAE